ncbi:MAG TPA: phosphoenolpyruvate synthase [Patescibacteria group bacterium]|nr:phosphoenolpyruvate synthase [Patescibacteria group bacterium]
MAANDKLILQFKDIDKTMTSQVGGKGANLGEMTQAKFPVPNGFAVTVASYNLFLDENNLRPEINGIIKTLDVNNADQLEKAASAIQNKLLKAKVPDAVGKETIKSYRKLSGIFKKAQVAVRSSATAEDLPGMSFAGQQATFLNIKGESNLLNSIRECWASLFTARAIFYRANNKIPTEKVGICVIIQKMVESEVSGVMFTVDPVKNDKERIVVDTVWGLGEMIVQGSVIPDHYVVQKGTFSILSKEVSDQSIQLIKVNGITKEVEVPKKQRENQKITDEEVVEIAKIGNRLQEHYYYPQDVEWARDKDGGIYIVQTRPITTLDAKPKAKTKMGESDVETAQTPILTGIPASPGVGTGPVRVLKSPKEIDKVHQGDVLVAKMTSPDYVPAMKKAAAIITDEGGETSHAAIVSRELGVPCVVGTKEATKKLKDDFVVTVDGKAGMIYLGAKVKTEVKAEAMETQYRKTRNTKTATHVYVNLAEPDRVKEIAKRNVDGIGLLRAEFMIANIGVHPKQAIKDKKQNDFINKLADNLEVFCKAFGDRPVVYRATDFKTNEYRQLKGGANWEPVEPNPLMGFRGAFRYVSDPEVFNLELNAIKKVRSKHKNLHIMIPFVRSPQELARVRRLVASEELFRTGDFKFWMMCELPVNVILLEDFIKVGIDGVSIGSNDLSMLLLGTDRDNSEVASEFDERSPALLWALRRIIKTCHKYGVTASICGQAPSTYDDLVEELVKMGITSVSINPDAIDRVRNVIYETERKIGK